MIQPPDITEAVQFCIGRGRLILAWRILLIRYRVIRLNHAKVIPNKKMRRIALELAVLQREFGSRCT